MSGLILEILLIAATFAKHLVATFVKHLFTDFNNCNRCEIIQIARLKIFPRS